MLRLVLASLLCVLFLSAPFVVHADKCPFAPVAATAVGGIGNLGHFYDFNNGTIQLHDDSWYRYGRTCRGCTTRLEDNLDGTVTDHMTGLMWTEDADIANGQVELEVGLELCESGTWGGHDDWRVPNIKELISLIDLDNIQPALPQGSSVFDDMQSGIYWSATHYKANNEDYWHITPYIGLVIDRTHRSSDGYIWCVRQHTTTCSCGGAVILMGD